MGGAKVDAGDERQLPRKIGRATISPSLPSPLHPPSKASTIYFCSGPPYSVHFFEILFLRGVAVECSLDICNDRSHSFMELTGNLSFERFISLSFLNYRYCMCLC